MKPSLGLHYLGVVNALVDHIVELVTPAHLTDVHPAWETGPFQVVPKVCNVLLDTPIVANEHRRGRFIHICN